MIADINIVLIEPEIPQNTGNVGRSCVALGACLHLVGNLGFSLNEKDLKRAGLDYWDQLDVKIYSGWEDFCSHLNPQADLCVMSNHSG